MNLNRIKKNAYAALIRDAYRAFELHDMSVYAAALAYHVLFSLFPFVIFLIALTSFVDMPAFFIWLRQQASLFLPQPAMTHVDAVISELQVPQKGLLSTGVIGALWLASRGVRALMMALNVAYGAAERRPAWKRYTLSLAYTAGLAAMLVAAATLMVLGPRALRWLSGFIGLKAQFVLLWTWLRWPAALALLVLALAVIYHFGPNVRHRFRLFSAGSVISVLVWLVASIAFGMYVATFADYSVMYGSIGAGIILLFYLYLSTTMLLFGAELNAILESRAPHARQPLSTRRSRKGTP